MPRCTIAGIYGAYFVRDYADAAFARGACGQTIEIAKKRGRAYARPKSNREVEEVSRWGPPSSQSNIAAHDALDKRLSGFSTFETVGSPRLAVIRDTPWG